MHIEAVGAAFDLGGTNFHELGEAWIEAGRNGDRYAVPFLHQFRGHRKGIKFGSHDRLPSFGSDIMTRQELPL